MAGTDFPFKEAPSKVQICRFPQDGAYKSAGTDERGEIIVKTTDEFAGVVCEEVQ